MRKAYEYLFYILYYLFNTISKREDPRLHAILMLSCIVFENLLFIFIIINKGVPYFMHHWNPVVVMVVAMLVIYLVNWYLLLRNNYSSDIIQRYKKRAKQYPNRDAYIGVFFLIFGLFSPLVYFALIFDYLYK